jgi:integrase
MQRKNQDGSVVFNRKSQTWRLFVYDALGKRRTKTIGTRRELPTKTAARLAAKTLHDEMVRQAAKVVPPAVTVASIVEQYQNERMPTRYSTRRSYNAWLRNHVVPRWGAGAIADLQPRPVELWLASLPLSARSRADIRGMLSRLCDFAMWSGTIATGRNPMSLVRVPGASKRSRDPRSLTVEEFQRFVPLLREPFRTIAVLSVSLGLRISECLGLQWSDVDWLAAKLSIRRAVIRNHVGDCKTIGSRRALPLATEIVATLRAWKTASQFGGCDDWIFASPSRLGRVPWSYDATLRAFKCAAASAGIGNLGTHTMRHSFRSWLDAVGTSMAVQQKLMRHADIRTTMNIYGDVVTDELSTASGKVARLAVNSTPNSTQAV